MEKMHYPKGLISYTTEHKMAGGTWTWRRPKLIGYGVVLIILCLLFSSILYIRTPVRLDVLRDRGQLYQEVAGGLIENVYILKIINMSDDVQRYALSLDGIANAQILPQTVFEVAAREMQEQIVRVRANPDELKDFNTEFDFTIVAVGDDANSRIQTSAESRFLGPRPLNQAR
jgi:polyferredoxin